MSIILFSLILFFIGGLFSLVISDRRLSSITGALSAVIASVLPIPFVIKAIINSWTVEKIIPWSMPGGLISFQLDPLSSIFMIPLLMLTAAVAIFGYEYLFSDDKHPGLAWFSFNLLAASMICVLMARNGIMFLFAWEIMSLSSLLLVVHDHEKAEVQRAGWIYFAATHTGTAFLFPMFFLLAKVNGDFNLSGLELHSISGNIATAIFILMIIGFGCKAGIVPFHIWLPEAHPAAPSHVSALMSGIMIKMGIYGMLRMFTFLGNPQLFWGVSLLVLGLVSGITGILFAVAQKDIKKLLAYSSVENIGIITSGIGIGLLGLHYQVPFLTICGFTGALLHVVNHAFFKGLLFLSAGAVFHATGTRDMEKLGGLIRKMPLVAAVVLIGSLAICGLPPLNGFISEFFIYFAALKAIIHPMQITDGAGISILFAFACIGGLAVICFTRFFGIVFLGEPREKEIKVHKTGLFMKIPLILLTFMCLFIAAGCTFIIPVLQSSLYSITGIDQTVIQDIFANMTKDLFSILLLSLFLIMIFVFLLALIKLMLRKRTVKTTVTWDCGYAAPNARMQYTGTSYVQPVITFFSKIFRPKYQKKLEDSYFPQYGSHQTDVQDIFVNYLFRPAYSGLTGAFSRLRWLQGGKVHIYIMYIAIAIVAALIVTFSM